MIIQYFSYYKLLHAKGHEKTRELSIPQAMTAVF